MFLRGLCVSVNVETNKKQIFTNESLPLHSSFFPEPKKMTSIGGFFVEPISRQGEKVNRVLKLCAKWHIWLGVSVWVKGWGECHKSNIPVLHSEVGRDVCSNNSWWWLVSLFVQENGRGNGGKHKRNVQLVLDGVLRGKLGRWLFKTRVCGRGFENDVYDWPSFWSFCFLLAYEVYSSG